MPYEEIFLGIFCVFLTIQTTLQYSQGKKIEKLTTMMMIICREHKFNHGGESIV